MAKLEGDGYITTKIQPKRSKTSHFLVSLSLECSICKPRMGYKWWLVLFILAVATVAKSTAAQSDNTPDGSGWGPLSDFDQKIGCSDGSDCFDLESEMMINSELDPSVGLALKLQWGTLANMYAYKTKAGLII